MGKKDPPAAQAPMSTLLIVGVWFGIVTGLIEGTGLLLFQRINWERWGPTIHVSQEILWISPLVDVCFFLIVALAVSAVARLARRLPGLRVFLVLLTFLAVYDWLTVTGRLHQPACLLLALGAGVVFSNWTNQREEIVVRFWRKTTPWLATVLVLVFAGTQGGKWLEERNAVAKLPAAAPGSTNVIVIVLDTLRADHLSSYGYGRKTSPNIDRLAEQGVLFENAVSTSSWTLPSHVSLVTGRYLFEHGTPYVGPMSWFGDGRLSFGGHRTLGEALGQKGYRTGAFSANRTFFTGNLGFSRGFSHFEDFFDSPADMFARTLWGSELFRDYVRRIDPDLAKGLLKYGRNFGLRKPASAVNEELLAWIDRGGQRPFFAFLNYLDVHEPYGGPQSYRKPQWEHQGTVDKYDDGVKYVDDCIARLMHELERRGLANHTLVVITSDHGESLGQHQLATHGYALYWEEIHVPLVIWYPGHVPAGVRIPRPVSNAAMAATVMDLLYPGGPGEFPGPALSLLWKRPETATNWPEPFSELAQNKYPGRVVDKGVASAVTGPMKSLVTPRWQLIVHKQQGTQLYDWTQDPGETNNVINTPEGHLVARKLTSRIEDVLAGRSSDQSSRRLAAVPLHRGILGIPPERPPEAAPVPVNDYYRVSAVPGSTLTVEVRAQSSTPMNLLDPMLAIEDAQGNLLQSCRDPGDDHRPPPGAPDSTPSAFDDVCLNDDITPGVERDSKLELLTPGPAGPPVELYVRVSDWNGHVGREMNYAIGLDLNGEARKTTASGPQPPNR